ncbi:hypothetical protein B0A50_04032 [Salinomyces thailandicus]|uniref:Exportin-5 C-terminal domain-containing protein n=1 Tax=Salinomyces thailandicus TaxID=706561 RepID=A0A4U0U0U3_9PEZI|nr:hypothetical protein B0A50_04032 [Salinomyces thailandica]
MDGAFDTYWQAPLASAPHAPSIRQALTATLDPRIPNDVRQRALEHLEALKTQADAPQTGFTLADDWESDSALRYYGLQLLEYAVRYRWPEYGAAQTEQLRTWVRCLAGSLRAERDPLFLRNKIAQLWVEVAKRCWGDEWMDMDAQLVNLWEKSMADKGTVNKVFVLYVLETLSEDVINGEDAVAGLRLEVLGASLNEVMISAGLYEEYVKTRGERKEVRCGEQGWLARICEFFSLCVKQARMSDQSPQLVESMSACAVKTLNALRPTMAWISLRAAAEASCVDCLFLPFHTADVALQTAATETLFALLSRPYNAHWHDAWLHVLLQALRPDRVALIRSTYEQTASGPGEDDAKYTLQKKMSELLSVLADAIAQHPAALAMGNKLDLPSFFDLLLYVLQSKSLVVSIPVLHSWSRMMAVEEGAIIDIVFQALGPLVQTCSARLLRYENIPAEANDEIIEFLDEDFDTVPERHAFLGNYRRYCISIIQTIGRSRPLEALQHVLEQMRSMLQTGPYTVDRGFDPTRYYKASLPVLQFDAQYNVVVAALKGYATWCADTSALPHDDPIFAKAEQDRRQAEQALQEWSHSAMSLPIDEPEIAAMVLQTLVTILRTTQAGTSFLLRVVQHLLTMHLDDNPAHAGFSDAVKGFESLRVLELQKLALSFSNELLEVYQELEPRIDALARKHGEDVRLAWGFRSFLFMIIHRATNIEPQERMARLQSMLAPVYESWQDPHLAASVETLQGFCEALGLGDLAGFYKQHGFERVADWSAQQLDESGQARQAEIRARNDRLPLRMTKSMLAATTEKMKPGCDEFETACALWSAAIPVILPNLLQMLRHAQAYHNPANWTQLPDELQQVVRRTMQDRFWQAGISAESKEQFYARVSGSKTSFEGFASVVRGTMRNIREQGYHVLYLMTKFDEQFYGLPELAEPLAEALFADAEALSANHLHPIINLTTGIVQRCPPHHRARFLPPLLTRLFGKLDAKIAAEWEAIGAAGAREGGEGAGEEELGDEMRMESVLRQLTFSMVSFVPFLLEFDRAQQQQQQQGVPPSQSGGSNGAVQPPPAATAAAHTPAKPTVSDVVLSDPSVLEPLILFCTHALRMRDQRCCSTICKVFRTITPLFQTPHAPAPQVREFISTEVLKACITSLHEPYFADLQKELASLIAQVLVLYGRFTATPREVLLSLPEMGEAKVDRALGRLGKAGSERLQRAIVLELLEGVRGVGIHEAGRIRREVPKGGKGRATAGLERYMQVEQLPSVGRDGEEVGLDGVADLFGEA